MDRYAVIGHPVGHSLSPVIHALFAGQIGHDLRYDQMDVSAHDFETAVQAFFSSGGSGLNITLPHKHAALNLSDHASGRAQQALAANTLTLKDGAIHADNTDGAGLVCDLTEHLKLDLSTRRLLILGSGGAAHGILGPLLEAGPVQLIVANRTLARARALVKPYLPSPTLTVCSLDELDQVQADLIINATFVGGTGPAMALPNTLGSESLVAYDLMYGEDTWFLQWGRQLPHFAVCDGLGMLVEQAAGSFEIWHGVRPDTAPVRERLQSGSV